jgi:L-ribulose-5-phosphate 3-epimerase
VAEQLSGKRKGTQMLRRRELLRTGAGAALAGLIRPVQAAEGTPAARTSGPWRARKSVLFSMLPERLGLEERFRLAREVGFEGVEAPPLSLPEAEKVRAAAEKAGVRLHSVIYGGWHAPLSDPDPAVVERGRRDVEAGLRCARALGADTLLLVPAVVNAKTRYVDAYHRSQRQVRALLPLAERLGVTIAVEEVWNNFLLSPLEFARYVDEFHSPFLQAYFDVGNVVAFAWPEDWVRTLGHRIRRVHLKDFKRDSRQFVNLGDGDVDWPEVRRAFLEVGFQGYMTCELAGGEEPYLRDVSRRVDRILAGA